MQFRHRLRAFLGIGAGLFLYGWWQFLFAADTPAVVLHLRNGDRLSGAIVTEDTRKVVLMTSWTNHLELPVELIQRREATMPISATPTTPPSGSTQTVADAVAPTPEFDFSRLTEQQKRRLAELSTKYKADKLTAREYHQQRVRVLAESVLEPVPGQTPSGTMVQAASKPPQTPASALASSLARATEGVSPSQTTSASAPPPAEPQKPPRTLRQRLYLENWHGNIQMGLNMSFGTLASHTLHGRLQAAYAKNRLRNAVDLLASYGKTEGVISANRMDGSLKTELDWKKERRLYVYHLGGAGYDQVRQINLSYQEGAGLGYHLLQRTNLTFNLEAGGNLQGYRYASGNRTDFVSMRLGQDLTWALLPKLLITEKIQYLPNVDDFTDYKVRLDVSLSYPFFKNLTLNINVIDQYDSRPAPTVDSNDLQILSTLGYTF